MLISKKWLSQFVKLPSRVGDPELANAITASVVEVEGIKNLSASFEKIVVGKIETVDAHPNADRLKVCKVNVGAKRIQVVCGGANVASGMNVAVALSGAKVKWHGEGEAVELSDTKIRGVESQGMICSSLEIGLPRGINEGEHDILDLGDNVGMPGTALAHALGQDDVIFEIDHKSLTNRPDLLCHIGMAREVSALFKTKMEKIKSPVLRKGKGIDLSVIVEDKELCSRYTAVALEGVRVVPSPRWMQNRLNSCGVRAINNVVDVTNYVMLEMGQPMHAFDADAIGGSQIEIKVRNAKKHETIACLDEETYELAQSDLLITDGKNPIAIAGVMGGSKSAVGNATTRIVFESANFSPVSVRKTSQRLSLRSESSARFEKAIDPQLCDSALARAVELLRETCPNVKIVSEIVDVCARFSNPIKIKFTANNVCERLGAQISAKEIGLILTSLGFDVKEAKGVFNVCVPSWRATKDITSFEDVLEEIVRLHGYDNIPSALPCFRIEAPHTSRARVLARRAKEVLAKVFDANEVYRYAFVSGQTLEVLGFDVARHLRLANPLADDRPFLVRSLVPNLLECVRENQRKSEALAMFECERVFLSDKKGETSGEGKDVLPLQPLMLAGVYSRKGNENPFAEVREMVVSVFSAFGIELCFEARKSEQWQHAHRSARILASGKEVGVIAEVDVKIGERFGFDNRVGVFGMDLDSVATLETRAATCKDAALFPSAERDIAFVINNKIEYTKIEKAIWGVSEILREVRLFDVYRGEGVGDGKKSMAIRLVLRADDRTLDSSEVDDVVTKIRSVLEKEFSAIIRI
jgi:phenylalanyl-tRNA synthetase beta chain